MRLLLLPHLLLWCVAAPAHADLYRWIDPETGSVKLSSMPPSDPTVGAEVVPYRAPAAPKPPVTAAVAAKPAAKTVEALQARWSELMTQLTGLTPRDFSKGAEGFKQQMAAYDAVRVELDRLDPSGVARRNAESTSVIEKLRQGFAAQFSAAPPAPPK
ncbi:MAG TPA: DUF4124 domain-containing protein [Burkholderiales bacterium]|nr:DUF4124 domain-containing protein [Burkholderiales bacterium]